MVTVLVLAAVMGQADGPSAPAGEPQFSESFRKRRAWEAEQLRPSWRDHVAVAVSAFAGTGIFTQGLVPPAGLALGVDGELGGHLAPSVALVGTAQGRGIFLRPGLEVLVAGFGGGLRLGSRHFVTLGGGAAFLIVSRVSTTVVTGLVPTIDVRGGIVLVGKLGLHFRAGLVFAPGGAMVDVGVGFGFSS